MVLFFQSRQGFVLDHCTIELPSVLLSLLCVLPLRAARPIAAYSGTLRCNGVVRAMVATGGSDGYEGLYDQVSPAYYRETYEDVSTLTSIARSICTQTVLEMMRRHVRPESVVADLGAGRQSLQTLSSKATTNTLGSTLAKRCMRERRNVLRATLGYRSWKGPVESVPLPSESLDAVICIGVLKGPPRNAEALREIHRTLRKGGIAIISFPNLHFPMFFLRATLRPIIAPVLRRIAPKLRNTVYVSV